jgi:hypothetical protein
MHHLTCAVHEKSFADEIDNVAHIRVKIDVMCAFHFATRNQKVFRNLAHERQRKLERQSVIMQRQQSEQGLTTGLLEEHNNTKLMEETQAVAQRLRIPLSLIEKGNKHLPPWGPPLIPGDARIEEVDEWIFPAPWVITNGSGPKDSI